MSSLPSFAYLMTSWKFIHAADLHLDSPLEGLKRYEGAPVERMRESTRRAFENVIDLCLLEEVKFLVIAGDIYDGDWKDFSTGLFFCAQLSRLLRADIRVFLVRGNHDAKSVITKEISLPKNTHEFQSRHPETVWMEELGVSIHGQSYSAKSMTENLALGYPQAVAGHLNIGLLHTSLDGRPGHAPYAPCRVDELLDKGYDYWALGHVHEPQVVHEAPWIAWSGTSQARHVRESGPKGVMLVTVDAADRSILGAEFRSTDVVRWCNLDCDVTGANHCEEVMGVAAQAIANAYEKSTQTPLAVRLRLVGICAAHGALVARNRREAILSEIRAAATSVSDEIWVEKVVFDTSPEIDMAALASRNDAVGGLLRFIDQLRAEDEPLEGLSELFSELRAKLPSAAFASEEALDLETANGLRTLLDGVEALLVPSLVGDFGEEDS